MVHIYNSINRNISLCDDSNFQLPFPVVDHSIGYISDYFDRLMDSSFISKSKLLTEKKSVLKYREKELIAAIQIRGSSKNHLGYDLLEYGYYGSPNRN